MKSRWEAVRLNRSLNIVPQSPAIMGVLNITPDSFSDGGQYLQFDQAISKAKQMHAQGADWIDIGGESTRPGAPAVDETEELSRVIPILKALKSELNVKVSVDTSKAVVMRAAIAAGVDMINDVCALQNQDALEAVADDPVPICLMHMQGSPRTMQDNPSYGDVVDDIKHFFDRRIEACLQAGIDTSRLVLDPGFGFGKTLDHNIEILKRFSEFKTFGLPLLAGLSRKSMIGAMLGDRPIEERMVGSVIGAIIAINNGADIVRVHDVLETKDAIEIWQRING